MSVKVVIPGPLTTVQDAGRYGYMNSGIGTSGVMDEVSYKKANYLVGNENGEAVLEVTCSAERWNLRKMQSLLLQEQQWT